MDRRMFSKATRAVGIDVGSHSVKVVALSKAGGRYRIEHAGLCPIDPAQLAEDPVEAQGAALREALRTVPLSRTIKVGALPGQTVVIRYPRLPDQADAELAQAMDREASRNLPFELSEVYVDWTVLDRTTEADERVVKTVLVAAKHELIDTRVQIADAAGIQFNMLSVDSLALADAAEGCDFLRVGETVALIDLGVTSTIIHFVRDGISSFYRDVNWGARELTQALMKTYRCDAAAAEQRLRDSVHATETAPAPDSGPTGQPARATMDAFDEIGALDDLDSLDAPSSPSSAPDAPGALDALDASDDSGGSLLDPLEEEVGPGLARPLAPSRRPAPVQQNQGPSQDETLHAPLSRLVTEVRRSFDYYEQQLYERPVDRVVLSGGVAHLPFVAEVLREELGFEQIEVADPSQSALLLGSDRNIAPLLAQPAQFMVAVGLAARGAAEL